MGADLSQRLVPDGLWELVAPLLPPFNSRPQGGGTAPCDERAVFTAVVYVLTSGCAWRHLPETFGISPATAHRRFTAWIRAGLWRRLHRAVLDELGARGELDWASAIVDEGGHLDTAEELRPHDEELSEARFVAWDRARQLLRKRMRDRLDAALRAVDEGRPVYLRDGRAAW